MRIRSIFKHYINTVINRLIVFGTKKIPRISHKSTSGRRHLKKCAFTNMVLFSYIRSKLRTNFNIDISNGTECNTVVMHRKIFFT
jgi:hypothetical protein